MAATFRHRLRWMFRRSTTPAERQMAAFSGSLQALARATEKNRPSTA